MTSFIVGPAGSGKTTELSRRILEQAETSAVLVTAGAPSSLEILRKRCAHRNAHFTALPGIAYGILSESKPIDDVQAALFFEEAAAPLLSLEWTEFVEAQLDPEIPGLRAPRRFLDAAFLLFSKLRDANIRPEAFRDSALRGATSFYGKPPNFAHPDLLAYTKDAYHDSLDAGERELERQYRREIDLTKILAKLYTTYLEWLAKTGCLTPRDAVAEALSLLSNDESIAAAFRARYPTLFADDVQELTLAELQLLQSLYGESLEGVTLAGDAESAISLFRGARPERIFALPGDRHECTGQLRSPFAIDTACRRLNGAGPSSAISTNSEIAMTLFRATTQRAEAQFVAERVRQLLADGAMPDSIAILFRSVRNVGMYRDTILNAGVHLDVSGDLNLFEEPDALDALALLWLVNDPFRHEYVLRVLSGDALALSDASLATLCAEPDDGTVLLFEELAEDESDVRSGHWDPKRDLRLGWNLVRGDRDSALTSVARERVQKLRVKRQRWVDALRTNSLPRLARRIWSEGLARAGSADSARAAYQQLTLQRLHARIVEFAKAHSDASLAEFLEYAEERASSQFESCETATQSGAVRMLSLDAARGLEFDHVILPNVRAGAFPRWYSPDAFLYSPSLGMIAKENVGEDARASRTAKFTYYMFAAKTRDAYNRQERRAFVYGLRRAKRTALVTAYERATRGIAAPELLFELQAADLPGTIDLSDKWQPGQRSSRAG